MSLRDLIYVVIGRMSLCFDLLKRLLGAERSWKPGTENENELDRTGIVLDNSKSFVTASNESDVLFPLYPDFAISLWRAQEFSLFHQFWKLLSAPMMDFGCGDGSFSSILSKKLEYGVDIDDTALHIANQRGIYNRIIKSENNKIDIPDNSVGSIISNSVLEHLTDLDSNLQELHRILVPHGYMMFSVHVKQYERDLQLYYGKQAARKVNMMSYHRNLFEPEKWSTLLTVNGFEVEQVIQFQPAQFTFWFRMCRLIGKRGFSMFIPGMNEIIWKRFESFWLHLVRDSIRNTRCGGNIFVIARKKLKVL